jgi:predicted phosphodiesterase
VDNYDKIVFIGDYVDSRTISRKEQERNLVEIINFKKQYPDKVVLLKGNHDVQYFYPDESCYRCSGFSESAVLNFHFHFKENAHLFQYAYQYKNVLFTHAGYNRDFHDFIFENSRFYKDLLAEYSIADSLNMLGTTNEEFLLSVVGEARGGDLPFGGITWCDANELANSPYFDEIVKRQVVGHTHLEKITQIKFNDGKNSLTFIDVLTDESTIENFYLLKSE